MTEDEAKMKWCPQYREMLSTGDPSSVTGTNNRPLDGRGNFREETRCIGSACMAWRWHLDELGNPREWVTEVPGKTVFLGYCGLAGKP